MTESYSAEHAEPIVFKVELSVRVAQIGMSLLTIVALGSTVMFLFVIRPGGRNIPTVVLIASPIAAFVLSILLWRWRCVCSVAIDDISIVFRGVMFNRRLELEAVRLLTINRRRMSPGGLFLNVYARRLPAMVFLPGAEAWACFETIRQLNTAAPGIGPDGEQYAPLGADHREAGIRVLISVLWRREIVAVICGAILGVIAAFAFSGTWVGRAKGVGITAILLLSYAGAIPARMRRIRREGFAKPISPTEESPDKDEQNDSEESPRSEPH